MVSSFFGRLSCVGIAALFVASASVCRAYPTAEPLWGATGLGVLPTTDTVAPGQTEVGLGYENVSPGFGGKVQLFPVASATHGLERAEIGAGYAHERFRVDGFTSNADDFNLNGKFRFAQSSRAYSGVPDAAAAVGVHFTRFGGFGNLTSLYLTGSKVLSHTDGNLLRGHLGLLYQDRSGGGSNENTLRPMIGLELRTAKNLTFAADYIPRRKSAAETWSIVARYEMRQPLSFQIGYGQFKSGDANFNSRDKRVFASVAYRFGQ